MYFLIFSTNESQSLNINLIYNICQKIVGDAWKYFNCSCTKEKKPAQTNSLLLFYLCNKLSTTASNQIM